MRKLMPLSSSFLTVLFLFPAFCSGQAVSIVSGNGQLVCLPCGTGHFAPLVVEVNDAAGSPVANTTVTWTTTQSGDQPLTATSTTNAAGQATYAFMPLPLVSGVDFYPSAVVASALGASVTFYETTGTTAQPRYFPIHGHGWEGTGGPG